VAAAEIRRRKLEAAESEAQPLLVYETVKLLLSEQALAVIQNDSPSRQARAAEEALLVFREAKAAGVQR